MRIISKVNFLLVGVLLLGQVSIADSAVNKGDKKLKAKKVEMTQFHAQVKKIESEMLKKNINFNKLKASVKSLKAKAVKKPKTQKINELVSVLDELQSYVANASVPSQRKHHEENIHLIKLRVSTLKALTSE